MFFINFNRISSTPEPGTDPDEMLTRLFPFAQPDTNGAKLTDRVMLVHGLHHNTASSFTEQTPLHDQASGITLASWARIDNRSELGTKLDLPKNAAIESTDSELILKSYLRWGEECVDHLIGDFVFGLYDEKNARVFCGRDHMGVRPLYYFLDEKCFVCATTLAAFMGLKGIPIEISGQWMAEYMLHLSMSFDETPYRGIRKLPPAHCLTVTPGQHRLRKYFTLGTEPPLTLKDSREYIDVYREQLEEAIHCRLASDFPIGSELSGGIDSSTITAFAAKFLQKDIQRLHAFAFANCELEPEYIMSVSRKWRLPHTHVVTAPPGNKLQKMARAIQIYGYPEEHANGSHHEPFYQLAETFGIRTMLSGFGGDEFVTTIHGYLVPLELVRQGRYADLFHVLPGSRGRRLLRAGKHILNRIRTRNYTRQKFNKRFHEAFSRRWSFQPLHQEMADAFDLRNRYMDTARFDAGYTDLKKFTLEKRWAPFVPTRMENCTLMAAARKIEYRWPLLDVRLVNLFLRIPSRENFHRMGRYLHRRAITGVVPDLVTWKQGKDMGMPVLQALGSSETDILPHFSVEDLHPALAEFIDMDKLARQLQEIKNLHHISSPENREKRMISLRNAAAAQNLSLWLKQLPAGFSIKR